MDGVWCHVLPIYEAENVVLAATALIGKEIISLPKYSTIQHVSLCE
jgi:hypothetical protein